MSKKLECLKNVSIFSGMSDTHLEEIISITIEKKFKKNKVIFNKGDRGNVLFILTYGTVKLSLFDQSGKEMILKMLYKNDFFGEMSLLDDYFRSATVTAVEDSQALLIYRNEFMRLIHQFPGIALEMLKVFIHRLKTSDKKIVSLTFFDAFRKVSSTIMDLAEKTGRQEGKYTAIDLTLTRQDLANMMGLSRETLTRILQEFHFREILNVSRKKIVILNQKALEEEIEKARVPKI